MKNLGVSVMFVFIVTVIGGTVLTVAVMQFLHELWISPWNLEPWPFYLGCYVLVGVGATIHEIVDWRR